MARTTSQVNLESAPSPASPTRSTARVSKDRSDSAPSRRVVRSRIRMLSQASNHGLLGNMTIGRADGEQQVAAGARSTRAYRGKGKSKVTETKVEHVEMIEDNEHWIREMSEQEHCSIMDKDTKPFRVMDLPTEIRLEIWRACLTRPYKILLSKREPPPTSKAEGERETPSSACASESGASSGDDAEEERQRRARSRRGPIGTTHHYQTRSRRQRQLATLPNMPATPSSSSNVDNTNPATVRLPGNRSRRSVTEIRRFTYQPEPERSQNQDPLITNVLRASKEIYKEARSVLYSENYFVLDLYTAMQTLGHLHQRSRRQIKYVEVEIPTYNEILERFQETVRLSLRYCSGLKKFIIHMPFTLPGADGSGTTGNTTVYANGFDILRWLPQECKIIMKGNICAEIETVVNKHLHLAKSLDKLAYARRQLISNETTTSSASTT